MRMNEVSMNMGEVDMRMKLEGDPVTFLSVHLS